jgi:hypothetical protein
MMSLAFVSAFGMLLGRSIVQCAQRSLKIRWKKTFGLQGGNNDEDKVDKG